MGNGHHRSIIGRLEPEVWPREAVLTPLEAEVVAKYRVERLHLQELGELSCNDQTVSLIRRRKSYVVTVNSEFVAVIRHGFPSDDTVVYTVNNKRQRVTYGAAGFELNNLSRSLLVIDYLLNAM